MAMVSVIKKRLFALALLAAFTCLLTSGPARAALSITPPQLAPDERGIIATEVKSSLGTASRWSVRVVEWNPESLGTAPSAAMPISGGNALGVSGQPLGVQISPRFFSLAASGKQVIRARVSDRSKHYRLLIEQIPEPSTAGQGVNFRFRFSLPVYRSPQDPLIPQGIVIH
jgi:P pilus assembly chaperone PapD